MRAALVVVLVAAPALARADAKSESATHVERATSYHQDGRFALALGELEVAYTLDPQPDLLFAIAQVQMKLNACGRAVRFYQRFLTDSPDAGGHAAAREAIKACKGGATPEPNHVERATALHKEGKFADALGELTLAYTLEPQADILYAIGQLYVKQGDCPQATLYYERFLAGNPDTEPANAAREAIESCPKRVAQPTAPPPVAPVVAPVRTETRDGARPWFVDPIGDALVGGGLVVGAIGIVVYASARSSLDDAEKATTYADHAALVDRAHSKRTKAALLGVAGVALIGGGVARLVLHDRGERAQVALVPATDGAMLVWSGSFR
jgi:tetratricopeptide (TPR) repeat protein